MLSKKIISVVLSVLFALSLPGCSKGSSTSVAFFSFMLLNFDREVHFSSSKLKEGDTIRLGSYESIPLRWTVLRIEEGKMLVLSKYGLFGDDNEHRRFGSTLDKEYTWEDSQIRMYLNSDDLLWKLFTENEQEIILETELETDDNPFYGVDGGRSTTDKLFLLSIFDILENFNSPEETLCTQLNGDRCGWWLRTPGNYPGAMTYIGGEGELEPNGVGVSQLTTRGTMQTYAVLTVRPAMWVAIDGNSRRVNNDYKDHEEMKFKSSYSSWVTFTSSNPSSRSTVAMETTDDPTSKWEVFDISDDKVHRLRTRYEQG